jgi:hypothetical protein
MAYTRITHLYVIYVKYPKLREKVVKLFYKQEKAFSFVLAHACAVRNGTRLYYRRELANEIDWVE